MDVECILLLFDRSVHYSRPRIVANLQLRFAQVIKPLSAKVVSIRLDGQEYIETLFKIMSSVAKMKLSLQILEIEHE